MTPYELQKETFKAMKRFYSIYECVKMLCGPDIFKFAVKLNWNLLLGRWGRVKRQLQARLLRGFYRAYGHILIKRWESANKGFSEKLQAIAKKTRTFSRKLE
jgi:hypothetical protein